MVYVGVVEGANRILSQWETDFIRRERLLAAASGGRSSVGDW